MTYAENILGARPVPSLGLILLFALILAQRVAAQEQKPPHSANGVQRVDTSNVDGKQVFESRCAGCHGLDGRGGERAPDIAFNTKTQQRSDDELSQIVRRGFPGTGMPPFAAPESNVKNVVAYLRQLQGKNESARFPGNARKGRELFLREGAMLGVSYRHRLRWLHSLRTLRVWRASLSRRNSPGDHQADQYQPAGRQDDRANARW